MDLDFNDYEIEKVDFPYSISIPSQDFQKYCKDMVSASDRMEIKCTNQNLFLSCTGEVGSFDFELNECNGGIIITKVEDIELAEEIVQGLFKKK